jgi:hypothetical protein
MKLLAGVELQGGEGNTGSLPNSGPHHTFVVFHQENLPEVSLLHLVVGGHELLLQH